MNRIFQKNKFKIFICLLLTLAILILANELLRIKDKTTDIDVIAAGTLKTDYTKATVNYTPAGPATPTVGTVILNEENDIVLTESVTTTVSATATVTDTDGYSDITSVLGKIYRSGVRDNCLAGGNADSNDCYEDTACETTTLSADSYIASCDYEVWFHADPTDASSTDWADEYWEAWIKAIDSSNASSSATTSEELMTLWALDISTDTIAYGTIGPGGDTGTLSEQVTATNTGNAAIDIYLYGTDLASTTGGLLSGYSYRAEIPVASTSAGAQTNYQKEIIVHYGSGSNSSGTIYSNSHCQTDFDDIRFTQGDGKTLIDHWLRESTSSDQAVFWVELPSTPAAGTTNYYVYYGNTSAASSSSGGNTFSYFDHWTADNTGDWYSDDWENNYHWFETTVTHSDYRALESSSTLEAYNSGAWDSSDFGWTCGTSTSYGSCDAYVVFRWEMRESQGADSDTILTRISSKSDNATSTSWQSISTSSISYSTDVLSLKIEYYSNIVSYEWKNLTTDTVLATDTITDTSYIPSAASTSFFFHNQVDAAGGIFSWQSPTLLDWGNQPGNGGIEFYFDNWFIRKYANPEPTWATPGSEEETGNFIPVGYQEYATSSLDYGSGTDATSSTNNAVELDLGKPTSHPSASSDDIYWGIGIPADTQEGTYTGTTTFESKAD